MNNFQGHLLRRNIGGPKRVRSPARFVEKDKRVKAHWLGHVRLANYICLHMKFLHSKISSSLKNKISLLLFGLLVLLFLGKPIIRTYLHMVQSKYEFYECETDGEEGNEGESEEEVDDNKELDKLFADNAAKMSLWQDHNTLAHFHHLFKFIEYRPGVIVPPPENTFA